MIAIFLIIVGLAFLAFLMFVPGRIESIARRSADEEGRKVEPGLVGHRNKLYRDCLVAAQEGRFTHDHLLYRLEGGDDIRGFALTDETWAFGIQPYRPLGQADGFSFTREQSEELAELLSPLRVGLQGLKAKKLEAATRALNGEEE